MTYRSKLKETLLQIQILQMPKTKLEIRQFTSSSNNTYLFYRYWDDKNKNWEYQVYELVQSMGAARDLGAPDKSDLRKTNLNTREMCDWVFENVK
jgi:hypothetical protein